LTRATAVVSAAHKYLLFANGDQVGAGPSFSYPDEQYAQSIDVTASIHPGQAERARRAPPLVRAGPG
jgi:hypothetical protein